MGRVIAALAALLAVVAGVVVALDQTDNAKGREITAIVPQATNLIPGQELLAGARRVGRISKVETVDRGRRAQLTFSIEDDSWPLPKDSKFAVRWGGTASFYNRYVRVTPGPADGPVYAEGDTVPADDILVPVEVDELLATFDAETRRDLKSLVNRSGVALDRARKPLEGVLRRTPPAITEAAALMGDVTADPATLDAVVRRTDRVVGAVQRADPGLSRLLGGTAQTFDAIAAEQQGLRTTLERLPGALDQTQDTLQRADGTLRRAGVLARRIAPGVAELRRAAAPVDRVLDGVQDVAPDARAALRSLRAATPQLNPLLQRATTISPQLGRIGDEGDQVLRCIRPYSPELMGLTMTWADFLSWGDGKDKVLRATVQNYLPAPFNNVGYSPAEAAKAFPGLRYGFPRPPGYLAGQPWFLPECGAGPDALDPTKDQEARQFQQQQRKERGR